MYKRQSPYLALVWTQLLEVHGGVTGGAVSADTGLGKKQNVMVRSAISSTAETRWRRRAVPALRATVPGRRCVARRRRRVVYGPITYRRVDADPVPIAADAPFVRVGPPRDFACGAVQRERC